MGQNLALNFRRNGYSVVVYNRTIEKTKNFVSKHPEIVGSYNLRDFTNSLSRPRRILLMITAGMAVDENLRNLGEFLVKGDVVIDGGNSFFQDTERRCITLSEQGIHYMGAGISGGEEGALKGPCIMVGGSREGYDQISRMLIDIAAKSEGACCQRLGPRGAGHYVKMVHNGIEYAVIQVIAEAYDLLYRHAHLSIDQIHDVFAAWNNAELNSFLMEIATKVLERYDSGTKTPLVSVILDSAKQKGTGKWASQNAMDLGIPTPTIDAAVSARNLSALKTERVRASNLINYPPRSLSAGADFVEQLQSAVQASIIVSYAQGFHLMRSASREYAYELPLVEIARIWKGGCIIRAKLLDSIKQAYMNNENLSNLLIDSQFANTLSKLEKNWRKLVKTAKDQGIPIPAINASLDYFDGYRSERLPANFIQALRDYFGAHGYERIDREGHFHTDWAA
jgi:6-phosphogluconate dehydrogenase